MLYLISIGLWDEKDLSIRGLETAKSCDSIYLELYTVNLNTDSQKLSKLIGKPVKDLERSDLEEKLNTLLEEAKTKNVAILVGGDALSATTHVTLLEDAKKKDIKTKVIHGSSIFTAIGETGLQLYKFGKTTTLSKDFPGSCLETIVSNKKTGLHTLVLLDIGMTAIDALNTMVKKLDPNEEIVVACHLGSDSVIKYGKIKDLLNNKTIEKTPAVVIIPGELHFMEKEFLESL